MGWTSYHATYYKKNGTIDRKAECDAYFMEGLNAGFYRIVKSTLIGSVYYAAVENLKRYKENENGKYIIENISFTERKIWAAVFLTSVDSREYYNFSYKDMDETMGPSDNNCPLSVLSLLSPTDNKYANEWRQRCLAHIQKEKTPYALKNLPIGAVIRFSFMNHEYIVEKCGPTHQFKSCWWKIINENKYFPKRSIPEHYEVVAV